MDFIIGMIKRLAHVILFLGVWTAIISAFLALGWWALVLFAVIGSILYVLFGDN